MNKQRFCCRYKRLRRSLDILTQCRLLASSREAGYGRRGSKRVVLIKACLARNEQHTIRCKHLLSWATASCVPPAGESVIKVTLVSHLPTYASKEGNLKRATGPREGVRLDSDTKEG